jgi:hypothetical protein
VINWVELRMFRSLIASTLSLFLFSVPALAGEKGVTLRGDEMLPIPLPAVVEVCGPSEGLMGQDFCLDIRSVKAEHPQAKTVGQLGREVRGQIRVLFTRQGVSITPNRVVLVKPLVVEGSPENYRLRSERLMVRTIMKDRKTGEIFSHWHRADQIDWLVIEKNVEYIGEEYYPIP